jgi:hypothetical protein
MVLLLLVVLSGRAQANQIKSGIFGLWAWGNWSDAFNLVSSNQFDIAVGVSTSAQLDIAQSVGMKCLVTFGLTSQIANDPAQWQTFLANLKTTVANQKGHPAVFAWYPVDEPDGQGIPTDKIKTLREVIRSIDTSKPIFTVLGSRQQWIRYLPFFDIISIDPYLTNTVPGTTDQPTIVRDYLRQMKSDMKKAKVHKPLWLVVGAFAATPTAPGSVATYLTPTPAQFNQMVNIGVQEGVDGILVYTLAFSGNPAYLDWNLPLNNPALWDTVRGMPGELKALP